MQDKLRIWLGGEAYGRDTNETDAGASQSTSGKDPLCCDPPTLRSEGGLIGRVGRGDFRGVTPRALRWVGRWFPIVGIIVGCYHETKEYKRCGTNGARPLTRPTFRSEDD